MINIFEVFVDVFTFGIYSGYKNQCILEKQYKEREKMREKMREKVMSEKMAKTI
jgi:fructosamine-3-kinase